jgi:hypothetical protein
VHKLSRPWKWQCKQCATNGYRFSPLVGTIFENTNVGLGVWFKVIFAMCHSKKGISALQIFRMVGGKYPNKKGAYRTAWYMCMRIRCAMQDPEFRKLFGIVEVDETYIGGKDRNRHWNKKSRQQREADPRGPLDEKIGYDKVGVVGAIARKGNVVAKVIGSADARTLAGFVRNVVDSEKVELLATDEKQDYNYVDAKIPHEAVHHSEGEYVRGVVHTNDIESGVHIGGHPAVQEIDDDAARRRRLPIPRADRRRGVHDHDWHTCRRGLPRFQLGQEFRTLIVTDHLIEARPGSLVWKCPTVAGHRDGCDCARIYDALHTQPGRDLE